MKNWSFKKFDGVYTRGDTKIGINKSGLVRFSSGFCRITLVTRFRYCVLFYDVTNNAVAFKFVDPREDGVVKVTRDTTGATISSKSFFKANKLDLKTIAGRYAWDKQTIPDVGEVYIIELSNK